MKNLEIRLNCKKVYKMFYRMSCILVFCIVPFSSFKLSKFVFVMYTQEKVFNREGTDCLIRNICVVL